MPDEDTWTVEANPIPEPQEGEMLIEQEFILKSLQKIFS